MISPKRNAEEVEQDRLRKANEMLTESGEGWVVGFLPGANGCHELLDRTALLSDLVQRYLLDHPACVANPEWYRLANQAAAALQDLYQLVGAVHLGGETQSGQDVNGVPAEPAR
jgi:hypothetical protein